MNRQQLISAARLPGESQDDYRLRRAAVNRAFKTRCRSGMLFYDSLRAARNIPGGGVVHVPYKKPAE